MARLGPRLRPPRAAPQPELWDPSWDVLTIPTQISLSASLCPCLPLCRSVSVSRYLHTFLFSCTDVYTSTSRRVLFLSLLLCTMLLSFSATLGAYRMFHFVQFFEYMIMLQCWQTHVVDANSWHRLSSSRACQCQRHLAVFHAQYLRVLAPPITMTFFDRRQKHHLASPEGENCTFADSATAADWDAVTA